MPIKISSSLEKPHEDSLRGGHGTPLMIISPNAEMMANVISFLGHEPVIAFSGKQTIAVVSSDQVDFVLLDYMMPESGGIDTLHEIRSLSNARMIPIYLYSDIQSTIIDEKARSEGASRVLQKPISIDVLEKLIHESTFIFERT